MNQLTVHMQLIISGTKYDNIILVQRNEAPGTLNARE